MGTGIRFGKGGAVPGVAVAGGDGLNASSALVDGKVEGHCAVAAD